MSEVNPKDVKYVRGQPNDVTRNVSADKRASMSAETKIVIELILLIMDLMQTQMMEAKASMSKEKCRIQSS